MKTNLDEAALVLILPRGIDVSDENAVERDIDALDLDRIIICGGGSVRPKEASEDKHGQ